MSQNKDEGFISHLTELRKRLIQSFVCLLVLFVICYIFSEEIYNFLVAPYAEAVKNSEAGIGREHALRGSCTLPSGATKSARLWNLDFSPV